LEEIAYSHRGTSGSVIGRHLIQRHNLYSKIQDSKVKVRLRFGLEAQTIGGACSIRTDDNSPDLELGGDYLDAEYWSEPNIPLDSGSAISRKRSKMDGTVRLISFLCRPGY
jgi:hypothetical protein